MNRYIMRMLALKNKHGSFDEQLSEQREVEETDSVNSFAEDLMRLPEFKNYVEHHGYHFSSKLSEWASSLLHNKDQSGHRWSVEEVKKAVLGIIAATVKQGTWGDITYAANYAYATLYPTLLKDEAACLKYAVLMDTDMNNSRELQFNTFLGEVITKQKNVPWGEVI